MSSDSVELDFYSECARPFLAGKEKGAIPMKKTGMIDRIAETEGVTRAEARRRLDVLLFLIRDSLVVDGEVVLTSVGKIKVIDKPRREVRNPKTGEKKIKEPSKVVKFSASSVLKADIHS